MENSRTIMVANTLTQKTYKITTNASTLAELKDCLKDHGIDYEGLSFTEGITRSTLTDDAAALPTNIPYKGSTTNNLILLLTKTKKDINSGAPSRTEIYQMIKAKHLESSVKAHFGKNYTLVPSQDLVAYMDDQTAVFTDKPSSNLKKKIEATVTPIEFQSAHAVINDDYDYADMIIDIINSLTSKGKLDENDLEYIAEEVANMKDDLHASAKTISENGSDWDVDKMMSALHD